MNFVKKSMMKMMNKYIKTFADIQEIVPHIKNLNTVLLILDWKFSSENYEKLKNFLTNNQKIQLEKYWKLGDKYNYVATHAIVNIVFLNINNCDICDADIKFDNGKPDIENIRNIKYSISHTKQCAVIGFHQNEIGVDIENYGCEFDYSRILKRYFAYELNVSENIDLRTFYTLWTIKEAYSKFSKKGIKDIENIDIIKRNRKKAIIKNKNTLDILEIDIIDIYKMFVVAMCFDKNESITKGDGQKCLNL